LEKRVGDPEGLSAVGDSAELKIENFKLQ